MKSESYPFEGGETVKCIGRTLNGSGRYPEIGSLQTIHSTDPSSKRIHIRFEDGMGWWYQSEDFAPLDADDVVIAKSILSKKETPLFTQIGLKTVDKFAKILTALVGSDVHVLFREDTLDLGQAAMRDAVIVSVQEDDATVTLKWKWDTSTDDPKVIPFEDISGVWLH